MSFGYSILGFGAYPSRGIPDVSNVLIEDDSGNDNRYTKVENSSGSNATTHNNDFAAPVELVAGVSGGYTMTLNLNSSFTGFCLDYYRSWRPRQHSFYFNKYC